MTPALFTRAPDAPSMALLDVKEVEGYIKVLGLAPTKAKNLVGMSQVQSLRKCEKVWAADLPRLWEGEARSRCWAWHLVHHGVSQAQSVGKCGEVWAVDIPRVWEVEAGSRCWAWHLVDHGVSQVWGRGEV